MLLIHHSGMTPAQRLAMLFDIPQRWARVRECFGRIRHLLTDDAQPIADIRTLLTLAERWRNGSA